MYIKTLHPKDIFIYFAPSILVFIVMTLTYLIFDYNEFEAFSVFFLIVALPILYILQGVFLAIRRDGILIGIIFSTISNFICIYMYLNNRYYMYCLVYMLLETISSIFTKMYIERY